MSVTDAMVLYMHCSFTVLGFGIFVASIRDKSPFVYQVFQGAMWAGQIAILIASVMK